MTGPAEKDPTKDAPIGAELVVESAMPRVITMVGVALIVLLVGAAVILAVGRMVPTEYWAAAAGLSGALVGLLVPPPKQGTALAAAPTPPAVAPGAPPADGKGSGSAGNPFAALMAELMTPAVAAALLALVGLAAFVVGILLALDVSHAMTPNAHDKAITNASDALIALGSAAAGALVGLFAPPPGSASGQK